MSEELKPCPFCGGEAYIVPGRVLGYHIGCDGDGCPGNIGRSYLYLSEKVAIKAWNHRAELTCRMEYNEEWSGDELYPTEEHRLADLIEPDGKGIESEASKPVESDGISRDALLALADEMEQIADGNRLTGMMSIGRARSWADSIREALGVGR